MTTTKLLLIFLLSIASISLSFAESSLCASIDSIVTPHSYPLKTVRTFHASSLIEKEEQLLLEVGERKELPDNFKIQALVALSFYPELKPNRVRFEERNIKTTMKCVPRLDFLFRKRENRMYRICIDTKRKKQKGILLKDVPFNGQIGVIGHELGHALDYSNKSAFGILSTGFRYLFPKYRRKLENETDETAIDHQLGWQVYDFSSYVFDEKNASAEYIKYKTKYYYLPDELKKIILY